MAVNNTQYLSFLGGLVSPRLWLRSDMDKFGKWFATADNIRFHTVGSFENRFGTIKIGNTKNNLKNENIKLIKFDFGQGETCMLELGSGYFRVIAHTGTKWEYVTLKDSEGNIIPYIETSLILNNSDDIKYVQSGDIIFATNQNGIYEIKRLSKDFSKWQFEAFNFKDSVVSYGDENDDNTKTIYATYNTTNGFVLKLASTNFNGQDESFYNPKIYFKYSGDNSYTEVYSYNNGYISFTDFKTALNSAFSQYNITSDITYNNDTSINLTLTQSSSSPTIISVKFSYMTSQYSGNSNLTTSYSYFSVNLSNNISLYRFSAVIDGNNTINGNNYYGGDLETSIDKINAYLINFYGINSYRIRLVSLTEYTAKIQVERYNSSTLDWSDNNISYAYGYTRYGNNLIESNAIGNQQSLTTNKYTVVSGGYGTGDGFFRNKQNNETFMARNEISADYIHATRTGYTTSAITTESITPPTMKSNGFWRYNSSGLWSGEVKLQYSTDNGSTWTTFFNRKNSSYSNYSTTNDNTSGTIKTDGITILLRMVTSNIAEDNASKFSAELAVDKFEVNSVYKIHNITANNTAVVECVKGDIGEFTNNSHWREAEFSSANGYPTAIGFYQNRLFLGKEYKLYSSRINDFWDFYEPIEVADDDPMTISLLSYKVNTIQNIIGIRSFFAFTTGGEFGIGAEGGALTQASKFLKQISAHGSNSCNPIFCGDVVVFVDKTNNTVRAFRYSLESDGWEATDVSVLIEQILDGKKIITTEYMQDTKECLFLTDEGEIYVFKFFQEQNIAAWSVWKHAKYKITNICVLEDELGKDILYIAVNTDTGMQIEQFNKNFYCDSVETFSNETEFDSVTTTFQEGDEVVVNDGTDLYLAEVGENGVVSLRNNSTYATVGLSYTSTATLLSPEIQDRDGTFSTFNRKRPFKAHCFYRDSYGFKIGVEEGNKQEPQWQPKWSTADEETSLTTGKTSVLISARYDGSSRVSFVQDKPYPMIIENVLLETDYGGK